MKYINNFKSPNFDKRKSKKIIFIIIHYTALKKYTESISFLCNPKNKVSSHFLISQNGEIFSLVSETNRAWHAGQSYWNGYQDINSLSIGIELDFSNFQSNNKYSQPMINTLIKLIQHLKKKYNINNSNILGHSDIAPFRKIDPGPNFPWKKLENENLIFNPKKKNKYKKIDLKIWFYKHNIKSKKKISLFIFSYLGYDIRGVKNNFKLYKVLIQAYQSHYIQKNITGKIDEITINYMINHFLNFVLTKG